MPAVFDIAPAALIKPPAKFPAPSLSTDDAISAVTLLIDPAADPTFETRLCAWLAIPPRAAEALPVTCPAAAVNPFRPLPISPDSLETVWFKFTLLSSAPAELTPACTELAALEIEVETDDTSLDNGLMDNDIRKFLRLLYLFLQKCAII